MSFGLIPGLPSVGGPELIILLVVVLLFFGASRIPELAKGLGSGVREFRRGVRGEGSEERDEELTAGKDAARMQEEAAHTERAERIEPKH